MAGLNRRFGPATASRKPTSVIAAPAMRSGEIGCAVVPNQPNSVDQQAHDDLPGDWHDHGFETA